MDYESAMEIWREIRASKLSDLRQDLIELAVRYARIRVDYLLADIERQRIIGSERSACHNALISSCDILARNMIHGGEGTTWRQRLGNDRKVIGDFACHLHAILGVAAR